MSANQSTLAVQAGTTAVTVAEAKLGPWLVIAACTFNAVLCYINTRGWLYIGNTQITICELVILASGLFSIRSHIGARAYQISALIFLYSMFARLINPDLYLETLHDVAIMYIFYKLGTLTSIETGNRTLWIAMVIAIAFGVLEWKMLPTFENLFNIWNYYVNKGLIDPDQANLSGTVLYPSGFRGTAAVRMMFAGEFGSHRISSIFLEPTGLGYFAEVAFAWCVSTACGPWWSRLALLFMSVVCFVLPDSRLGSTTCLLMLILSFVPFLRSNLAVFLMPLLAVIALTIYGAFHEIPGVQPSLITDDFPGRLLFSGRLLGYWDLIHWMGFALSPVYTTDTGFAYQINNLGLPSTFLLLVVFARNTPRTLAAARMRAMIAIYYTTSLSIGNAVFSIKTAALLWFLYGTTNAISRAKSRLVPAAPPESSNRAIIPYAGEGSSA